MLLIPNSQLRHRLQLYFRSTYPGVDSIIANIEVGITHDQILFPDLFNFHEVNQCIEVAWCVKVDSLKFDRYPLVYSQLTRMALVLA